MVAKTVGCLALALSLSVGSAIAGAAEGPDGNAEGSSRYKRLKALDADHDGAVSPEEFAKGTEQRFARRDANKDGKLSAEEVVSRGQRSSSGPDGAERFIKRYDANADGRVTKDEYDAGRKAWFAKQDKDGDGKLSAVERPKRFARKDGQGAKPSLDKVNERAAKRFTSMDGNGDGTVDAAEIATTFAERRDYRIKRAMHRLDLNGDGVVTPDEFMAPAKTRFGNLDIDRDGRITAADLPPQARLSWTKP